MAPDVGRHGDAPILVFGANGQVGFELLRALAPLGHVIGLGRADADLADLASLRAAVRRHRPRAVAIAAGYTGVDRAESEAERATTLNAVAPGEIAREAETLGACVVHYSTDYVFDGTKTGAYTEADSPNPLNSYGRTKLAGELAVAKACARRLIFRASWVFSTRGTNFPRTMLKQAAETQTLRVVSDQVGAPTSAALVADATARVLREMLNAPANDPRWGLYHLAAAGETSWHGFARYLIARGRELGMPLRATPDSVAPIATGEYPAAARRPANSRLDTARLRTAFAVPLPDWTVGVDSILQQLSAP